MKFEKRVMALENHFLQNEIEPKLDLELTDWLKSHPDYNFLSQPESNQMIQMPNHLQKAFNTRLTHTLSKSKLPHNCTNLLKLSKEDWKWTSK